MYFFSNQTQVQQELMELIALELAPLFVLLMIWPAKAMWMIMVVICHNFACHLEVSNKFITEKEEQRRKLTPTVMTASFKNWSIFTENLALLKYCLCWNWWERVACSPRAKKSEFLVNLDRFSKFLKYFEKRSKLTKKLDFFVHGECATLSHHFEPS